MWRTNILRAAIPQETVEARSGMLFGHNTNVTVDGTVFHVQTEDRGIATAVLDTTVHCRGRVLHRRTTRYQDLLPLDADREQALKIRLDDQHRTVLEELRSGVLVVAAPPMPPARPIASTASPTVPPVTPAAAPAKVIAVEMLNPRTWLTGKHATLYLVARYKDGGAPAGGARITARVAGTTESTEVGTVAGADGHAHLEFDMPRLAHEDAALVIEAFSGDAHGQLRFQLRAKPKSPVG
ncbi:MAG: hypothetical protein ABSH13_20135 [Candidatus Acidiferrum sp.]|jgi:hypothetical protein